MRHRLMPCALDTGAIEVANYITLHYIWQNVTDLNISRSTIHCSMTKLHSTKSNKLKSAFTVTVGLHLTVDNTLGWESNGRPNFHRAYRSSSNSYIRCWSEAATWCSETSIRNYRGQSY